MGLYFISELAKRSQGELVLLSGGCLLSVKQDGVTSAPIPRWPGTVVCLRVPVDSLEQKGDLLAEIREELSRGKPRFTPSFEE